MKINVEVDLAALGFDEGPDGEPVPGPSLREQVVQQIVQTALSQSRVAEQISEEVRHLASEQARDVVATILAGPIQRTDYYGNPKGEAVTIRQLVMEAVDKWMKPADRYASGGQHGNMGELLEKHVAEIVTREMKPTIDAAKKAVAAEVTRLAVEGAAKALASARVI